MILLDRQLEDANYEINWRTTLHDKSHLNLLEHHKVRSWALSGYQC